MVGGMLVLLLSSMSRFFFLNLLLILFSAPVRQGWRSYVNNIAKPHIVFQLSMKT